MKVIGLIIGIVLVCIMFPLALDGITDAATDPKSDAFPGCVVAAGSTSVVLTEDLYKDATAHVTAMTATGAGAVPVASTYTAATNTLVVTGLGADTPQDLTVTYDVDATTDFTGLGAFMGFTPLLMWIALLGALLFGGFMFAKGKMGF